MTGNRHIGATGMATKDKVILTSRHEACDECRKPRREGTKRGGQLMGAQRHAQRQAANNENAASGANSATSNVIAQPMNYTLAPIPPGPPPGAAPLGKRARACADDERSLC